jgi:hypothetical protein
MNHMHEHETKRPRHVFDAPLEGDERRRAEGELLATQAHAAGAGRLDVLVPVRLTSEVQADDHGVPRTERTYRGVAHGAGLAPRVLQIGKRGMTGDAQGHRADRTARVPGERPRESHRLPAFLDMTHIER